MLSAEAKSLCGKLTGHLMTDLNGVCSHCQIVEDVLESRTQELAKTLETTKAVLADTGRMFVLENKQRKALEAENAALKSERAQNQEDVWRRLWVKEVIHANEALAGLAELRVDHKLQIEAIGDTLTEKISELAALKLEWSRLSGIAAERDAVKAELAALQDRAEIMEEALVEYHRLNNDRRLAGHPYDSSAFALAERARPARSE